MGFLDRFKKKARDAAAGHEDAISSGIDKGAGFADEKTGGRYTDKIDTGAEKAKDFVEGLADESE